MNGRAALRWFLVAGAFTLATWLAWAGSRWWTPSERGSTSGSAPRAPAPRERARALPEVLTLHEQKTSAYHARLFAEDESVVLVTVAGFTSLRAGRAPEEHAIALGPVTARQGDALVFWSSGSLREVSLSGGAVREVVALARPPRYLLASEGRLAWVDGDRDRRASLQTLAGGQVQLVHVSEQSVSSPVLHAATLYWVGESRDGSWSIERVDLDGKHQRSSAAHRGRLPAMLAVGHDGIYFYDGPQRGVRRLTFDLERETTVLADVVCSPLAVRDRVLCAQVGGLFEIPRSGSAPRFLASERAGPVTAVAATPARAYWVAESGAEQLSVRSVVFPAP